MADNADRIWDAVRPYLDVMELNDKEAEENQGKFWKPVGVNSLFRFIKYKYQGSLVLHYDAPYVIDDKHRTLMTLVGYIAGNSQEGHLRFIEDNSFDYLDREFQDGDKVLLSIEPVLGRAVLFPHRLAHDGALTTSRKILLRTDIVFERI